VARRRASPFSWSWRFRSKAVDRISPIMITMGFSQSEISLKA